MTVRTRFAPSPTGYLHVGGARTALYAYLYAKKHQGVFILRIEDTDLERSTPEAVQAIVDGMAWLGLHNDEGPFYQTQRFDRYREVAKQLVDQGQAYRCYCSKERLDKLRVQQMETKEKPRYDGLCRDRQDHSNNAPYVIRFKNPQQGEVVFDDAVHGHTVFHNSELDDLIIIRTDNTPTYNFSVVVDDADMQITHVIRGDDHLNNTPRQINILQALGATVPIYAHLPMILGEDGKKLSKRHGAVSVMQYRDEGFLPHALLNYLVRLGWSHGDQEIFSMAEMIDLFDIKDLNKSAAAFNTTKLLWLNQHYIKADPLENIAKQLQWHFEQANINTKHGPALTEVIGIQRERAKTLKEMAERSKFFYEVIPPSVELQQKYITAEIKPALKVLHDRLSISHLENWTDETIHQQLQQTAEQLQIKLGDLAQPVRVIISGGTVSPPLNLTMRVLGRTESLNRLENFI
jgi:glutamyl-tRNA synthetase